MNAKRFIVEGYHLVNEASKTNLLEAIISTDEKELKRYSCKKKKKKKEKKMRIQTQSRNS